MKDHEGYLPKGWMMHEPYCLHNGTPALAIYTYLYRTTRKNEWQGSLQTLADLVEIPINTVRDNLKHLNSRGLVTITPLAHSHYSIKAQRLSRETDTPDCSNSTDSLMNGCRELDNGCHSIENGCRAQANGCREPIKYNINIKENH